MTVAAREQFLSGSASPSNMASRRLISCSGGTRFPTTWRRASGVNAGFLWLLEPVAAWLLRGTEP